MKIFHKTDLEYKNGFLIKDDEVVGIDNEIVDLLNKLDTDIQRAEFISERQTGIDAVNEMLDVKFKPKSEFELPVVGTHTPYLDAKVEEAKAIMDELDGKDAADKANEYLKNIKPVVLFVKDDSIIEFEQPRQHRFDLPRIGNPLELDEETLALLVCKVFE